MVLFILLVMLINSAQLFQSFLFLAQVRLPDLIVLLLALIGLNVLDFARSEENLAHFDLLLVRGAFMGSLNQPNADRYQLAIMIVLLLMHNRRNACIQVCLPTAAIQLLSLFCVEFHLFDILSLPKVVLGKADIERMVRILVIFHGLKWNKKEDRRLAGFLRTFCDLP